MDSSPHHLAFWGVRGTVATPAPDRLGHGGNTICLAARIADDEYLVVDEDGHLQLPHDLTERARIGDRVTLELKEDGLLIKPVAGRSTAAAPLIAVPEDEPPAKRRAWWKRKR